MFVELNRFREGSVIVIIVSCSCYSVLFHTAIHFVMAAAIASPDINWTNLALNHELTGGLICNAVLSAISLALKTCINDEDLLLTEQYLQSGAKLQLRGLLEMVDFDRRVIPTFGISDLVLTAEIRQQLQMILKAGKTHKFLSAQWGFGSSENCAEASGISVLICGHPGTGKTAIAHSIAYELGQPIKVKYPLYFQQTLLELHVVLSVVRDIPS